MFDVYTMNGSCVIANTAGTESTAKIRSTNSMSTNARNSGVAHQTRRGAVPAGVPGAGKRTQNRWPWTLVGEGSRVTMPGWCNGSSGYVFLWTLAEETLPSRGRYLDFATGAAWDAWDAADATLSLCCGLAGRSYALLNLYRATNDAAWLNRARRLALRGATRGNSPPERAQCLWKGELGMAVLASDLERPEDARMPFFEPMGWS